MNSKMVGYFVGTDSIWLTTLEAHGYDTLPLSNGFDGHGMNIGLITDRSDISLVLTFFHKLVPPMGSEITVRDMLHTTSVYSIPVLAACPQDLIEMATKNVSPLPDNVELVDPDKMLERALAILKG